MLNLPSPTSPTLETQWPCPLPNPANPVSSSTVRPTSPQPKPTHIPAQARQATTPEPPAPPFRNVSACNRCRLRKHRCDQRLPRCESCEKAGVRCVGYDPLTKQEVPRSYVSFLENRVNYLTEVLLDHGIDFKPPIAYDEEETLRMEAERSETESGGVKDKVAALRPSLIEQAETISRKRKLNPYSEDKIPARQVKRLSQLNVLLKELFNDGCAHQCPQRERRPRQNPPRVTRQRQEVPLPRGVRSSWSPQSFQSMDHSDGRTSPETASPSSSHDQYPYSYHDTSPRRGMSLFGAASILDSDNASRVYEPRHHPDTDLELSDFPFNRSATKSFRGGDFLEPGNTPRGFRIPNYLPQKAQECPPPEPKFDIAADLLRGRRERSERVDRERANFDLLDEFLVDWAE
ncbi:hypothetical protein MYU51_006205 [Penicillium brevicompactum]|uniref:uncharacterized protein n=1 Tax=Penicillium brevicompactum TaxID=5074 RepID=UPI0025415C12|nr:uncharacterized protein N7506_004957 [Penicillium brevicompactum]KAJ5336935.1 hypothetical protein N7506_004957 [Penicillium brevicompactum]